MRISLLDMWVWHDLFVAKKCHPLKFRIWHERRQQKHSCKKRIDVAMRKAWKDLKGSCKCWKSHTKGEKAKWKGVHVWTAKNSETIRKIFFVKGHQGLSIFHWNTSIPSFVKFQASENIMISLFETSFVSSYPFFWLSIKRGISGVISSKIQNK